MRFEIDNLPLQEVKIRSKVIAYNNKFRLGLRRKGITLHLRDYIQEEIFVEPYKKISSDAWIIRLFLKTPSQQKEIVSYLFIKRIENKGKFSVSQYNIFNMDLKEISLMLLLNKASSEYPQPRYSSSFLKL